MKIIIDDQDISSDTRINLLTNLSLFEYVCHPDKLSFQVVHCPFLQNTVEIVQEKINIADRFLKSHIVPHVKSSLVNSQGLTFGPLPL